MAQTRRRPRAAEGEQHSDSDCDCDCETRSAPWAAAPRAAEVPDAAVAEEKPRGWAAVLHPYQGQGQGQGQGCRQETPDYCRARAVEAGAAEAGARP